MRITLPQQDIYFEQLLFPNQPIYNIGAKISIEGKIDVSIFKQSYNVLIKQHDSFRSRIVRRNGEIEFCEFTTHNDLECIDFSNLENPQAAATNYMQTEFKKPFDLYSGTQLYAFKLIKVRENFHYLFSVYHHIITDGWGTSLMFQRLVQNYNEIAQFGVLQSQYPYTYKDFGIDDDNYRNSNEFQIDKNYWIERFQHPPENLFQKFNPSINTSTSFRKELILTREFYNKVIDFSKSINASAFHTILASLSAYFSRIHQNADFTIGLPVLNRSGAKFKKTVGLFMGINPLRLFLNMDDTIDKLIEQIKIQLKKDYRHQRFPLGQLVNALHLFTEKQRLFNISLSYERHDYSTHFLDTKTTVIPLTHESERVALAIYIREFSSTEDVKIDFDYNLNYFTEESITKLIAHFKTILGDVITHSFKKIRELDYLLFSEKNALTEVFNDTAVSYPDLKTVIDLFENQVIKNPSAICIRDKFNSFTYLEASKISDTIAKNLFYRFGSNKEPICVIVNRSSYLVLLLLGIFKAGKYYIPIDPALPPERVSFIINSSRAKIIITEDENIFKDVNIFKDEMKFIGLNKMLKPTPFEKFLHLFKPDPGDTAYIIYTSGSTGNPKGVEIVHQSLTNILLSIQHTPGIGTTDILYSVTTYSFDISILEFFVPLISGATLYVAHEETVVNPQEVINELVKVKPTIIQATPAFYQMLFNLNWKGDKLLRILCGGDLLSEALAEKLISASKDVWNMYGPTETTIWSSIKKINSSKDASNIGKPINNTQFYVIDEYLQLLPVGIYGRIYIGGDGLAKGYYFNKELTDQKFIDSPFIRGKKIYDTGDIAKWNENGEIEFLGRYDNQVKIRGYRIELGEIETKLNQFLGTTNCVVLAKRQESQETILVAYIPRLLSGFTIISIEEYLRNILPAYMIPGNFIELDEFPLTPNNKVDRKVLNSIEISNTKMQSGVAYPQTATQIGLLKVWQELLQINDGFGINENFFSLGGHSLTAAKLSFIIQRQFAVDISMRDIFENPTIELLANYIETLQPLYIHEISKAPISDVYELTPAQLNIWLASQNDNSSGIYNMFSAFDIKGKLDKEKLEKSAHKLIDKYEILRTNFIVVEGVPSQKIKPKENYNFVIANYKLQTPVQIHNIIEEFSNLSFNLATDMLIKIAIVKADDREVVLFLSHHIIMDGLSIGILLKDLMDNYSNEKAHDLGIDFQFKDYAYWLNKKIKNDTATSKQFWDNYLRDYKKKVLIPHDFNRSPNQLSHGQKMLFQISNLKFDQLKQFSKEKETTIFNILFSSFQLFLHMISTERDFCTGVVLNGRNQNTFQSQVGMFVKTLPVRIQVDHGVKYTDFLRSLAANLYEIEKNQDLSPQIKPGKIFDLLFVFQNAEFSIYEGLKFEDVELEAIPQKSIIARYPFTFNFNQCSDKIIAEIDFDTNVYDEDTVRFVWETLDSLINQIISNDDLLIETYKMDWSKSISNNTTLTIDFKF